MGVHRHKLKGMKEEAKNMVVTRHMNE